MTASSLHRQRGVGLVEILVAVVILSIGLLGIGWVQTRALANNNSSMARSMAVVATYSILDAMRADRTNAINGDYDTDGSPIIADDCDEGGSSLAETQRNNWCAELASIEGPVNTTKGEIDCDDTGACEITITFKDDRVGADGAAEQTVITRGML